MNLQISTLQILKKTPEILPAMEKNYRILRRVYQQLHLDFAEIFAEFIKSLSIFEIKDMEDSFELLKFFQDFYSITGRLPLSNELLIILDADVSPDGKVNLRQLYDLYKNTNSHDLVSLPFLGLAQYYLEESDQTLIKNAAAELYYNLSYNVLSRYQSFIFHAVSIYLQGFQFY